jgi:hypothetical protein
MEEMAGISDSTHPNTRHADTPRPNRIDETTQQLVEQRITALLEAIPRDQSPEAQAALKRVQLPLGVASLDFRRKTALSGNEPP